MEKILICYFSATGITKEVSKKIQETIGGTLFEIEPIKLYTKEDLDWTNKNSRSTIEMKDKECRPSIKRKVDDIEKYSKILIGFPVWWYRCPSIINTFIEENNLEKKNIYIYCTSGSSTVDESFKYLQETYPNLNFIKAKRFTSNITGIEIKEFIN